MNLLTQKEKEFLLRVWTQVLPGGKTREEIRENDRMIESIQKKVEAMPVEISVEPQGDGSLEKIKVAFMDEAPKPRRKRH